MDQKTRLLFVYNADSGAFNTLADMGHKLFSPQTYSCSLCTLTHGVFREKSQWREFVASLPIACDFLHRDEFQKEYPERQDSFPAVFLLKGEKITPCLSARQLESCHDMQDLETLIRGHCIDQTEDFLQ